MSAPELKPCPFCGGKAASLEDGSHSTAWEIGCYNGQCAAEPHVWEATKEKAIAAWNRRADLPPTDAEVMEHPKVKALVEALQFYADKSNWFSEVPYLGTAAANIDLGDISRAALAALKGP
jgi:Lar family restriction alleviation protein